MQIWTLIILKIIYDHCIIRGADRINEVGKLDMVKQEIKIDY